MSRETTGSEAEPAVSTPLRRVDYVRIRSDAAGESRFEDVTVPTTERQGPTATATVAVTEAIGAEALFFRHIVREASDGLPHTVPGPELIVVLTGVVEVEVSTGEVRRFPPGSVILAEDTSGKGHTTRRVGETPRSTLVARLRMPPAGSAD